MHWSHFWWGIFCFDLPVGLFLCFLFHNVVRTSLPNLPSFMYRKFAGYQDFNWNWYFANRWFAVVVSLLLASSLHILWDTFTHFSSDAILKTGIFPGMDPSLRSSFVYYSVWSICSLLGFVALVLWFYNLPGTNTYSIMAGRLKYWARTALIAFLVIAIRLIINSNLSIIDLADSCISAIFIGLILSSIIDVELLYNNEPVA